MLSARDPYQTFWRAAPLTNLRLVAVVVVSTLLQCSLVWLPPAATLFDLTGVHVRDLAAALLAALVPVSILELKKLFRRPTRDSEGDG